MEIVQPEIKNSPRARIYTLLHHSRRGMYIKVDERFIIRSGELRTFLHKKSINLIEGYRKMLLGILRFEYSSEDINFMKIKKKIEIQRVNTIILQTVRKQFSSSRINTFPCFAIRKEKERERGGWIDSSGR